MFSFACLKFCLLSNKFCLVFYQHFQLLTQKKRFDFLNWIRVFWEWQSLFWMLTVFFLFSFSISFVYVFNVQCKCSIIQCVDIWLTLWILQFRLVFQLAADNGQRLTGSTKYEQLLGGLLLANLNRMGFCLSMQIYNHNSESEKSLTASSKQINK